ncbi:protein phosphatase 2C domain-containing protein [Microbispora sp. NBC_01189]|uniref:protein phosphatase 2C domain-containing protein n=1 Tax=Microbispora sp. NBC_01189 TaxID=2903583 RepID=UPI002E1461EB|nr:protein phosphatase 2C domain-containing protein [Microbispora sp. NBC_01189]
MEQVQGYAVPEIGWEETEPAEPQVFGREPRLVSRPGPLPVFRRPDSEIDGADLPGLTVRAASIRGDIHRHYGTVRQDAMGLWQDGEGMLLACVADGVGSKELSHIGAVRACGAAHEHLHNFFAQATDLDWAARCFVENVASAINNRAAEEPAAPDSLSTTFLAALIEDLPDQSRHRITLVRVGDSTAWLLREGKWTSSFRKQGEDDGVIDSSTCALPRDVDRVEVRTGYLHAGDMLMLCTDGLSNPMRAPELSTGLAAWWSQGPPSLPEFFRQMSFRKKTHDDDRTAVCVWSV